MALYSAGLVNDCLAKLNRKGETLKHNVGDALFEFEHCEDEDYYEGHKEKLAEMNAEYERIKDEEDETNLLILKYKIVEFCKELTALEERDNERDELEWKTSNNL